jgi:hypothetical protein
MVKNAKPWAMGIFHIKGHSRVITDIPVLFYIFPDFLNDLGRISPCFHTKSESGADGAIDGKFVRNLLAADAASLVAYGENFRGFNIERLSQTIIRGKGN